MYFKIIAIVVFLEVNFVSAFRPYLSVKTFYNKNILHAQQVETK